MRETMQPEQIKQIKQEFVNEYFLKEPYSQYMNMCAIRVPNKERMREDGNQENSEESIDGLCLRVGLRTEPPADIEFPSEYKGVRVLYEVIGEIRAYKL